MKTILNLTPHEVTIIGNDGRIMMRFAPEAVAARCGNYVEIVDEINGIPISKTVYTKIYGLLPEQEDTFYIVSRHVAEQNRNRHDLLVPNELVRDDAGRVVGCKSLSLL